MFSKRTLLALWVLCVGVLAAVAALPWDWAQVNVGETTKSLTLTGFASRPLVSAQVSFGIIGLAAVFLSRGLVRRVTGWVVATVSGVILVGNFGLISSIYEGPLSPAMLALVEKSTGIAGESSVLSDYSSTGTFGVFFLFAAVTLVTVTFVVAATSHRWTTAEKADKYQRDAKAPTKDDNLSLWDSQR